MKLITADDFNKAIPLHLRELLVEHSQVIVDNFDEVMIIVGWIDKKNVEVMDGKGTTKTTACFHCSNSWKKQVVERLNNETNTT